MTDVHFFMGLLTALVLAAVCIGLLAAFSGGE